MPKVVAVAYESFSLQSMSRGFVNVFSRRVTGFHRRAKHFGLNFFIRKTSL